METNYVLYKDPDRMFTMADHHRLERSFTEFLYVRSGDMEVLNEYMENSLADMLSRKDLDSTAKGRVLYQTSVNGVIDMFESPETATNVTRCRNMVQHIMQHVASDPHAMTSVKTIIDHNFYIFAHAVQVTALCLLAHEKLFELAPDEMIDVGIGSLIHDYGMTFITSEVLERNDALADIEYYKLKQHTQKGYEYLKQCGTYSEVVLNIVRYHHERYDGNGYPTGSKGDDIPRSGQLAAICDMYSSAIMDLARRPTGRHDNAVKIMREETRTGAFNPDLLERFLAVLSE